MSDELRERIARALYERDSAVAADDPGNGQAGPWEPWDEVRSVFRSEHYAEADAVLAALSDAPTVEYEQVGKRHDTFHHLFTADCTPLEDWVPVYVKRDPTPTEPPCPHSRLHGDSFSHLRCVDCDATVLTPQDDPDDLTIGPDTGIKRRKVQVVVDPTPPEIDTAVERADAALRAVDAKWKPIPQVLVGDDRWVDPHRPPQADRCPTCGGEGWKFNTGNAADPGEEVPCRNRWHDGEPR